MKILKPEMKTVRVNLVYHTKQYRALVQDSIEEATQSKWSRITKADYIQFDKNGIASAIVDLINKTAIATAKDMFEATLKKKGEQTAQAVMATQLDLPQADSMTSEEYAQFEEILSQRLQDALAAAKMADDANVFVDENHFTDDEGDKCTVTISLRKGACAQVIKSIRGMFMATYGRWDEKAN